MTHLEEISIDTTTQFEIIDITDQVRKILAASQVKSGVAVVFSPHTTAAIRINHNESLLKQDLMKMLYRVAPVDINYGHDLFEIRSKVAPDERSNGHAHVKAFLLGDSEAVPVTDGQLLLGRMQSIFFVELDGGRKRKVIVQILGE